MAKLYGTADPTLVSAAFRHGQSMVPGDTKAIEEWKLKNFEEFTTGVSEAFDKIYADDKKTMDLLTDSADKALAVMETGGMANDYNLGMHNDVVNGFKERLKGIPKGRKGDLDRSKLRSEMNNYLSNIQGGEEMFIGMTQNAANSRLLTDLGDDRARLFKAILDDHNDGTSLTKPKYEKGDIVYTLPGTNVKMTMREINEGLSTYDPKYLTGINKMLTDFKAEGKAKGTKWSADDAVRFKNKLQSSITSWDEIRNIGQEKFGKMNHTFEQVLTGQAKDVDGKINTSALEMVYSELEALGGIDMDGDNDIDDTDKSLLAEAKRKGEVYTDVGNGVSLIDVLKKDKQKYRDVMANFLTETAVKDFYGQGAAQFKGKTPKVIKNGIDKNSGLNLLKSNKSTELFGTNNGWTNNGVLNSLGAAINNRENIPLAEGEGEMIWDDKAGYIYKDSQGKTTIIDDKASLFQTFFQSESPISSPTLQTKWWKSVKGWGGDASEIIETPITSLKDLKKVGIDKNIFMKPADDIIDQIKAVLPEDYNVVTEKSGWGKKGDWAPFFRSEDQFIVTNEDGDEVGEFDTNYFKTPSKAKKELERFLKVMNENNALKISTEISSETSTKINMDDI